MDISLARIIFPVNSSEPEDLYQEKHFRIKQYFFQKAPIPKISNTKIKELQEIDQAFNLCYPEIKITENAINHTANNYSGNWALDFQILYTSRNLYKTQLASSISAKTSATLIEFWYQNELEYASTFASIFEDEDLKSIQINQETDPMILMQSMREIEFEPTLDNLIFHRATLPENIKIELKRLTKFAHLAQK